ncbi:hypothetical protein GR11A_00106 [Vibrio phage vB_VcorM_GR11A]|nr:hypothetical protein GR11A_00106 [Vibrio phage vB_VcorM_GR11A]
MIKHLLLATSLLLPLTVQADTSLLLGAWSYHYDDEGVENENHQLVGLCYNHFCAGTMVNSYDRRGAAVFYEYRTELEGTPLDWGYRAGVLTGYSGENVPEWGGIMPMGGLLLSAPVYSPVHLDLTVSLPLSMLNLKVDL